MPRSFWLAESRFELERITRASEPEIRALFADIERWVRLQPLVIEIRREASRPGFFRITDRLKVLGVPMRHTYRARIELRDEYVDSEAWSAPSIHLTNRISWATTGDETRLVESVHVEAPRLLLGYTVKTATRAHADMLDRICAALDSPHSFARHNS